MATSTSTNNKSHVTSRRLPMSYYFILTCSLFLSHPLYLYSSYFILLLPYFLKFLSFLSPLFITTSLVLLLLLTFSPGLIVDKNSIITAKSKLGFCRGHLEKLRPNAGDEKEEFVHQGTEECEVYKILFEVPQVEVEVEVEVKVKVQENGLELEPKHELAPDDKFLICGEDGVRDDIKIENSDEVHQGAKTSTVEEDSGAGGHKNKTLEGLFLDKVEPPEYDAEQGGGGEEDAVAKAKQWDSHSQSKRVGEAKEDPIENMESDPLCNKEVVIIDNIKERDGVRFTRRLGGSVRLTSSEDKLGYKDMGLNNYRYSALGGSMRREKEWKRTLACKLYEERNGGCSDDDHHHHHHDDDDENGEGMDILWETYENDSTTTTTTVEIQTKSKTEKSKSCDDDDHEEDEDEDEKLCCLQVLKFSAGKMGRRPNLVKISKALTFRGMGLGFLKHKHGIRTR